MQGTAVISARVAFALRDRLPAAAMRPNEADRRRNMSQLCEASNFYDSSSYVRRSSYEDVDYLQYPGNSGE